MKSVAPPRTQARNNKCSKGKGFVAVSTNSVAMGNGTLECSKIVEMVAHFMHHPNA